MNFYQKRSYNIIFDQMRSYLNYYFPNHANDCLQEKIGTIASSQSTINGKTDSTPQKTNYNQLTN